MEYINRFYWLIALCLIISTGANASVNPKPYVIPELKEWKGSDGAFVPTEATKIVYAANNPELERIARIFAQDYRPRKYRCILRYTYRTSDCRTVRKSSAPERNPERLPRLSASRLYDRLRP